jgi:Zn finger protein HypA/HybF involved in hydrogenase expression
MSDDYILVIQIDGHPFEYFCKDCKAFRLSLNPKRSKCGNCQSDNIIKGAVEGLDRDKLFRDYGRTK